MYIYICIYIMMSEKNLSETLLLRKMSHLIMSHLLNF